MAKRQNSFCLFFDPAFEPMTTLQQEIAMSEWKTFLESRTVWANLVGLTAMILSSLGFASVGFDQEKIIDVILQVVAGLSFLASTVFRVLATHKLTV
jgi:hypothetical protein